MFLVHRHISTCLHSWFSVTKVMNVSWTQADPPLSQDFTIGSGGDFCLKRKLNYYTTGNKIKHLQKSNRMEHS